MHRIRMRGMIILAVLLMAIISTSMAACPRANSNLYTGAKCGGILDVAAPGILANDNRDPGATLSVVEPEKITIDPKYGSIVVRADGSFTYTAAKDMNPSTYVGFYYTVTDGKCTTTRPALVKIAVTCKCQVKVPPSPVNYCMPVTIDQIREDLIKRGAGCIGCGTPGTIDLSHVNVDEEGCYPYYVTGCGGCSRGQGQVCLVGPCVAEAKDIELCEGEFTLAQVTEMARENSTCTGDCDGPAIELFGVTADSNGLVITGGHYIATCKSACGDVSDRGEITVWQLCDAKAENIYVCEGTDLATVIGWVMDSDNSSCDNCEDAEKAVDASHITTDNEGKVTGGFYTVTCTVGPGCKSTATGVVEVEICTIDVFGTCIERESFLPAPTAQDILDEYLVECSCGVPVIYNIEFVGYANDFKQIWHFDAYCESPHGCRAYDGVDFEWGICDQPPCPCEASAPDLTICEAAFTEAQVKAMLAKNASCGGVDCETAPSIVYNLEVVNGFVDGGSYTVTCDPAGDICPTTTDTGYVNVIECDRPCICTATAPNICTCINDPLTDDEFIASGAKCEGPYCPEFSIDDSAVDYTTVGKYPYTVYCGEGCEDTGLVCVRPLSCQINTGDYGSANLVYNGEVIGTVDVSIGGFNYLIVTLEPAMGTTCGDWTVGESKMYAGVTPMNDCDPSKFIYSPGADGSFKVLLSNIKDWDCGDPLYVNVYASMSSNCGTGIVACTGEIKVEGYSEMVCNIQNCVHVC